MTYRTTAVRLVKLTFHLHHTIEEAVQCIEQNMSVIGCKHGFSTS